MQYVETIILRNLQYNEDYARKVIPYIRENYFSVPAEKEYYNAIDRYFMKYNALPTKDALDIEFQNLKIGEELFNGLSTLSGDISTKQNEKTKESQDWLLDTTEQFCKDKALFNALTEAISIAENSGDKNSLSKTAIPALMNEALAVSFDQNIGHNYLADADERFDFYHQKRHKISTHLEMLNTITDGGPERKTVNCIAAGTGAGKSMLLCDLAAGYIRSGNKVLYITNEMAEEKISQRIDANLMNIDISKVATIDKNAWDTKIEKVKKMCSGELIVKEYPTSTAHVGHYRFLLKELEQKQNFIPDVIIIDYLNICASSKYSDKANSYGYIKSICEELRGLAVETNTCTWTATQVNRSGIDNSDIDLTNISECISIDSLVELVNGEMVPIKQLTIGDKIKGSNGFVSVLNVFDKKIKKCYKITTKSGKEIICSAKHKFPTNNGRISINDGLCIGKKLNGK